MNDLTRVLLFLVGYVVLMKWVLPWLGVGTCMSGACNIAARRKRTTEQEPEGAGNRIGRSTPER